MGNTLYIVVPCYNEEVIFDESHDIIYSKLKKLIDDKKISQNSKIVYVNDGSFDSTLDKIKQKTNSCTNVEYISLSKNFGQQNALIAGLKYSNKYADMTFTIDLDLQDDIDAIDKFILEYEKGCDIVYGVRESRKTDSLFKKSTALLFYNLMKFLKTDIVYNHSECRLMSKKAIDALFKYSESNIFLRGMVKDLGFKYSIVKYNRKKRNGGKSKYNFKKMYELAKEGITSFSVSPLKIITKIGCLIFFLSVLYCIYAFVGYLKGNNVVGWTTIVGLICLFSGFQILCIGIIGEYIAKIYSETKRRPTYLVDETSFDKE